MLIDIAAEQAANQRNVAEQRCLVFHFLDIFPHQSADDNGLAVSHLHTGGYLARAKDWLINHVLSEKNWAGNRYASHRVHAHGIDGASVIDEAFELDHLRNQVQVDGRSVCSYHWFNLKSYAGITRLELCRRCRRHHYRDRCRNRQAGYRIDGGRARAGNLGKLRLRKFCRVTKFSNDFYDGSLPAFGCNFWRGKKIDPFFRIDGSVLNVKQ